MEINIGNIVLQPKEHPRELGPLEMVSSTYSRVQQQSRMLGSKKRLQHNNKHSYLSKSLAARLSPSGGRINPLLNNKELQMLIYTRVRTVKTHTKKMHGIKISSSLLEDPNRLTQKALCHSQYRLYRLRMAMKKCQIR